MLLLFLGGSVILSLIIARGASSLKTPLIVGYIVAGAIVGPAVFNIITKEQVDSLNIINLIVLSLIGFGIGGELQISEIKKLGKQIIMIVLLEALGAFILVSVASSILLKNVPLGIIFGALASATAPAGTVEVIKQYKAKGSLTTTLYAVMAFDDILALILYSISFPVAMIFMDSASSVDVSIGTALLHAGKDLGLAILIGGVIGYILTFVFRYVRSKLNILQISLAVILINCGLSELLDISPIMLNMVMGIVLVNREKLIASKVFTTLGEWSPPMYIWFFVLIGAHLNLKLIHDYWLFIVVYIVARSFGKWGGTFLGATITKAEKKIRNYLGLALFSQAGVAVGLALAAAKVLHAKGDHELAEYLLSSITATTFIVMLIGPIFAKIALLKSGEAKHIETKRK